MVSRNQTFVKAQTFEIAFLFLYVDDGPFVFNSRKDLGIGSLIAFNQTKGLRLNMHVGVGNKKFKTKAMYIPSRSVTKSWINDPETYSVTIIYSCS